MHFLLEQQRTEGFGAFAGTDIQGRFPLRESVLNNIAQAVLQNGGVSLPAQLRGLRILPQNRIALDLSVKLLLFRAPMTVTARLEPTVEVANGKPMVIHLEGIAAVLSPLLRTVAGKLPSGVTLRGDQIVVEPVVLLTRQGFGDLVPLVRHVAFFSTTGLLNIEFHLHLDPDNTR